MTEPTLVDRVRRRLASQPADLDLLLRDESGHIVDDAVLDTMRRDLEAELRGAGPLEPLLAIPGVTDVLVNGPSDVWLDRGAGLERARVSFHDDAAVRRLAQRLAALSGVRLDDAMPYADAVLPDGTRVHAVLPPLVAHPTISLRVLARRRLDIDDLVASGSLPGPVADQLRAVVAARLAFVVSGGTGSARRPCSPPCSGRSRATSD